MALDPMKLLPPRTIRWTRDEYYRMEASGLFVGRRVELIRGEVFELSPQSSLHASAITLLDSIFHQRIGPGFLVRVQLPLSLGQDSDPEPDIAIVKGDVRTYVHAHPSTAGLVVEASESSLEHDRTIKSSIYAEAGIPEYWILNLLDRRLEVRRRPGLSSEEPHAFGYGEKKVLNPGDSIAALILPDVSFAVSELLP